MKVKFCSTIALALMLLPAFSQDPKLAIEWKPEVGKKTNATFEMHMSIGEAEAEVTGTSSTTIDKLNVGNAEITVDWQKISVILNGEETQHPFSPIKVTLGADGEPIAISGGIQGTDAVRTFLLTHFPKPDKSLGKGESTTFTIPAKGGVPERKITETFVGPDSVDGKAANKVDVKMEEVKGESLTLTGTFWVLGDGTVLKEEASFSSLPVPITNTTASGKIKINAAP